jgi:hypothetical protein
MVNFPSGKMRTTDFPLVTLPVSGQDKSSLSGTNQYSYVAHIISRLSVTNEPLCFGHLFLVFGRSRGFRQCRRFEDKNLNPDRKAESDRAK